VDWGLQLHNPFEGSGKYSCELQDPKERCEIQHYSALATEEEINARKAKDYPWASYYVSPELKLDDVSDKLSIQDFQAGEKGKGWGFLCPVFEERTTGSILEVCYEQWLGNGPQNRETEWLSDHFVTCTPAEPQLGFNHTYDKLAIPYHTYTLWSAFEDEPLLESEFPLERGGGTSLQIDLLANEMAALIEYDNFPYRTREGSGGFIDEPAVGSGCGRSLSTNPAEWALIGVGNGLEEWETGEVESGRNPEANGLAKEILRSIDVRTEFIPHEPAVVSENAATNITETEAKISGEVNAYGFPSSYAVQYGTASVSEHTTGETSVGTGTSPVPVSTTLTSLRAGTTYKYRIKVVNTGKSGAWYGSEKTFTTTGTSKPYVETKAATSVAKYGATLHGVVYQEAWKPSTILNMGKLNLTVRRLPK
jgi:hypothetical protein